MLKRRTSETSTNGVAGRLGILNVDDQEEGRSGSVGASFVLNVSDGAAARDQLASRDVVEREEA